MFGGKTMTKKTVQSGKRIVDVSFDKDGINVSVWVKDDTIQSGYQHIGESNFKVDSKGVVKK